MLNSPKTLCAIVKLIKNCQLKNPCLLLYNIIDIYSPKSESAGAPATGGAKCMREFAIRLTTVEDIKAFVRIATVQPFEVFVVTDWQRVSAKSFMGMFSLDFRGPLRVVMECSEPEYQSFRQAAAAFLLES